MFRNFDVFWKYTSYISKLSSTIESCRIKKKIIDSINPKKNYKYLSKYQIMNIFDFRFQVIIMNVHKSSLINYEKRKVKRHIV